MAAATGGAIFTNGSVTIGDVGATVSIVNNQGSQGGAIYGGNGPITIHGQDITLDGNKGTSTGGAIFSFGSNLVTIGDSGATVSITNNQGTQGGAIDDNNGSVVIHGGSVTIMNNTGSSDGGAIATFGSAPVQIGDVGATVNITDNHSVAANGGAINDSNGSVI